MFQNPVHSLLQVPHPFLPLHPRVGLRLVHHGLHQPSPTVKTARKPGCDRSVSCPGYIISPLNNFIAVLVTAWTDSAGCYVSSVYWALASYTTTGYGDIYATNVSEMWVASLVILIGKFILSIILANVASTLAHQEEQLVRYDRRLEAIRVRSMNSHKF